jgi:hypothetical protein
MFLVKFQVTAFLSTGTRVARCFVFKPKIPIYEKFSGPQIGKC